MASALASEKRLSRLASRTERVSDLGGEPKDAEEEVELMRFKSGLFPNEELRTCSTDLSAVNGGRGKLCEIEGVDRTSGPAGVAYARDEAADEGDGTGRRDTDDGVTGGGGCVGGGGGSADGV